MNQQVCFFDELLPEQLPAAGGKGSTLARLYQADYPVPPGFVILSSAFQNDALPNATWAEVLAHLNHLRRAAGHAPVSFAVRSSALSEDSAQASFGGQFETVLDVKTDEAIHAAIRTVRQSQRNERVQAYSEAKGMGPTHEVAVVVQRLIRADISGILFTADPVSGSRTHMTGNYIYGLGDALVSGEAEPLTFTLQRPGGQFAGPPEIARFARPLFRLARRLERDLGSAQDLEWCVADGQLYLLQSRPITTLAEYDPATYNWNTSHTGDYLWARQEPFPEVVTPSTWSLWRHTYLGTRVLGIPSLGNIGGRLYLNVSFPYSVLRKLGKRHEDAASVFEFLLGPFPPGVQVPQVPLPLWALLREIIPAAVKQSLQQRRLKKDYEALMAAAPDRCRALERRIRTTRDGHALSALWAAEVLPLFITFTLLLDAYTEDFRAPYTKLKTGLTALLGEEAARALLATISGGSQVLTSVGPLAALAQVAAGELTCEAYTARYGHRHANENELAQPRPSEDPAWLDDKLAEFSANPVGVQNLLARRAAEFDSAWATFAAQYPAQARKLRQEVDRFSHGLHRREAIRAEVTRTVGVIRTFFLHAGELLDLGDAVFFLECTELLAALSGDKAALARIPARRSTDARFRALPPYPGWIRGRFDPPQWAAAEARRNDYYDARGPIATPDDSTLLKGYPGSAGCVEGAVRRIEHPSEGTQLQRGEILVAVTTNIGWTPLFPRAAAIVTDIGAPLAHAAIVARELGIPAVVGCGNATARLKTGDRVRVDGGRGTVEILEHAEGKGA